MSLGDDKFLSFLNEINPTAAHIANKMEELIFEDAGSAIVKARIFAETILKDVIKFEKLEVPHGLKLYEMISILSKEDILTKEIQQSLDIIRISGNKAAHVGIYDDLTQAFKLHKEMYKLGVWFYEVYSSNHTFKIPSYEKPHPLKMKKLEDLVQKKVMELLEKERKIEDSEKSSFDNNFSGDELALQELKTDNIEIEKDLLPGESYLERELSRLKESSQEAIENANHFSEFKDYLHVDRKIQKDLEVILKKNKGKDTGNLILICGSVGDGKSHLLAYLNKNKGDLVEEYKIFNDATESFSPNKDAMQTLEEEVLQSFSDQNIDKSKDKVILAINMGVLHNFINTKHNVYSYEKLKQFIEESELFSSNVITCYSKGCFDLLSFGDYHSYELTKNGAVSYFYSTLLQKITDASDMNPFYVAYKKDIENNLHKMTHENFKFLQNKSVQNQIVQLVIQSIVKMKLVISARAFLNFITDILIPNDNRNLQELTEFEVIELSLPNLLFKRKDRSNILYAINHLDPIHVRSSHIDQLVIELNTLNSWDQIINHYILDNTAKKWLYPFSSKNTLTGYSFYSFIESFIRITFLTNDEFYSKIVCKNYKKYLENLYYFNIKNVKKIKLFYEDIKEAMFKWKGSPKKDYIFMDQPSKKYRLAQRLNLFPSIEHLKPRNEDQLDSFKSTIVLAYEDNSNNSQIFLDIDYPLYSLLMRVLEGYRPNKNDEEEAVKFVEFIDKLMALGEKKNEVLVYFPFDEKSYLIKRDHFGAFVFERE